MLNKSDLDHTAKIVWKLQQPVSSDLKRRSVMRSLSELLNSDFVATYVIDKNSIKPERGFTLNIDKKLADKYEAYQFNDDIVTSISSRFSQPVIIDEVLDRKVLEKSDFYNDFLKPNGMHHGINMFVSKYGDNLGDFRIWRSLDKEPFKQREIEILSLLKPYFEASLSDLGALYKILTAKEMKVSSFLPLGLSDKEIARELFISSTTVRTHINNIMRKTGCKNRTHLAVIISQNSHHSSNLFHSA